MGDEKAGGSARTGKSKGGSADGVKLQKGAFGDGIEKTDRDRQKTTTGTFSAVTDKPQGLDAAAKKATKPTGDLRRAAHADGKVGKAPKSDGSATNKANALARASLRQSAAAALKASGGDKKLDAAAVKPDGVKKPDDAGVKTDGAKKPDAAAVKTDGAKKPDAAAVKADGAKKPDAAVVKADGAKKLDAAALKTDGAKQPDGAAALKTQKPTDASPLKAPGSVDKPAQQSSAPKLAAPSSAGSDGKSMPAPLQPEAGRASSSSSSSSSAGGAAKGAATSSGAQGPKLEGAQAKREVEAGLVSDRPQGAKPDAQPGSVDKPAASTGAQGTPARGDGLPTTAAQGIAAQKTTTKEADGQGETKSSAASQPAKSQLAASSSNPLQRSANAPQPLTADAKLAALTKDVPKAEVAEIAQGVVDGLDRPLTIAVTAQRESDIADALSANTEVAHASRRLADADFFADTTAHIRESAEDIDGVLLDDEGRASAAAQGLPFVKGADHSGINLPVITADMKLMASVLANQRMDASDITSGLDDISGSDSDGGGEGGGGDEGGGEE